ncbi:glycosyltransferase family A protein [Pelagibius sp.]|uniref:glycosyltransferase family 2 protein n=1 Tax=Pelagibius sp. TaxID=1931238 RepID=UPI00262C5F8C|nr:glycosyltransferase family A protein [Pelagibius sp.]
MTPSIDDFSTTAIVSTFNRAALVSECVESLLGQTLPPAQIIVVNDGSDDDTEDILRTYGDRIEVVQRANKGKSAGINLALSMARHPLIWIVDDDDLVLPQALAILTGLLKGAPEAGFAYGRYLRFAVDPRTGRQDLFNTGYWETCAPENFLAATLEDFFVHQPGMLVRRAVYDQVGPFDERLPRSQDYDMLIRLARVTLPAPTEAVLFHQRQHDGDRGTAAARFTVDQRELRWIEADKQILQRCYRTLELREYLSSRIIETAEARRHALLQRATIMARKKLWDLALDDLESAALVSGAGLSATEKTTLRRAVFSKYGCRELLADKSVSRRVQRLARRSTGGRQMARTLARGLLWRVKEQLRAGNRLEAGRLASLMLSWGLQPPFSHGSPRPSKQPRES